MASLFRRLGALFSSGNSDSGSSSSSNSGSRDTIAPAAPALSRGHGEHVDGGLADDLDIPIPLTGPPHRFPAAGPGQAGPPPPGTRQDGRAPPQAGAQGQPGQGREPTLLEAHMARINRIEMRRQTLAGTSPADLIRQALVDLPLAMTTDAEIGSIDELIERAEQDDEQLVSITLDLVPTVPLSNPLSGALISIVLDAFPLPSMRTVATLSPQLLRRLTEARTLAARRNTLTIYAVLAEKLAGRASEILLSPELLTVLLDLVKQAKEPITTLYALLAIEKFAQTGVNKQRMLEAGAPEIVRDLESKYCNLAAAAAAATTAPSAVAGSANGSSSLPSSSSSAASFAVSGVANTLRKLGRRVSYWQRLSVELEKAQIGFCSMWLLDNVLPCDGRAYAATRLDLSSVNVMLDYKDATQHLKLAPDGLEARNDALSFESVRATCRAQDSGLWFYEVTVFTGGVMQVGWATERCAYKSEEGIGIGDDQHSFSYDGCRRLYWHRAQSVKHNHPKWKPGDVLGLYLDLDRKTVNFSLNGHLLGWHPLPCPPDQGLYPAVSLMTFQHVQFNFGNQGYRYPPKVPFRSLNGVGKMTAEEKNIVPRLVKLAMLQDKHAAEDDDAPRCQICFDSPPTVVLLPCKHAEFCMDCSKQCVTCPLCRCVIDGRQPIEGVEEGEGQEQGEGEGEEQGEEQGEAEGGGGDAEEEEG
eukprot:m.167872 g.167872  ORF g.167872 m.167872 type:complete len:699 (-) comp17777_c4_seq2:1061-3157(-)